MDTQSYSLQLHICSSFEIGILNSSHRTPVINKSRDFSFVIIPIARVPRAYTMVYNDILPGTTCLHTVVCSVEGQYQLAVAQYSWRQLTEPRVT